MFYNPPPVEAKKIVERQFLQEKTFNGKFEVVWNFIAPYIKEVPNTFVKTVDRSIFWRKEGNKEFISAKDEYYLSESIEAYTKSIADAPVGSEELSLAYANRSAVLFRASLYEDCLLDIERSLKSGYPDHLKTKLYVRQALCFKALKPNSKLEADISMASAMQWLSNFKEKSPNYNITNEYSKMMNELKEPREINKFIPEIKNDNAIIVGASDAIELKKTNKNNQHIVATRDIKSGEFIYISEPFAAAINTELRFTNCWHCCRSTLAGVPCDDCPSVIYCSDICKKRAWHSYHNIECSVLGLLIKHDRLEKFSKFGMITEHYFREKYLIKSLNSVGGLIELKKKIDNIDSMKNKEVIFTNGILDVNTIDNFLRLDYFEATSPECTFESAIRAVLIVTIFALKTDIFGKQMTLKDLIKSKDKKILILGELILRYTMIARRNSQFVTELSDGHTAVRSTAMIPFYNILKQSCYLNVNCTYMGSNAVVYACKPIKQGQPILMSPYHMTSKIEPCRQSGRSTDKPKPCKCTACVENWPTMEHLPYYQSMILPTRAKMEMHCTMLN
ncbi:SET and MYND domain-containing protein 4-like [Aphidius gifuensis]|uniref:SET and MYND domain-containing protein 4-like n=1 Tax=Aphidius gifuensis TaxID=684658 RepID=UPI001CDBFB68|nr:SET and MYND domain-containing protein 4-like [Aphidius gifuensis]